MRLLIVSAILFALHCASAGEYSGNQPDDDLMKKARKLAQEFIVVDTHIDAPEQMLEKPQNLSKRTKSDFDYVKAREGGLNCGFMAVYVPASYQQKGGAKVYAEKLAAMVEGWTTTWSDKFVLARSAADVTAQFTSGKISLAMGMENAAGIEHDLKNIQYFYDRGIRYVTLTHAKDNLICDSSYDTTRTWHGLSAFGRDVIAELNRVGIMVDVSHVSDSAFYQVMQISKAPVIASHSSCRYFTPGFERNMSDDMIKLLASRGGVIQINFGSSFISDAYRKGEENTDKRIADHLKAIHVSPDDSAGRAYARRYYKLHPVKVADVSEVAQHIDHVTKLVGVDYVGFGSDFDGVGNSLPTGLKDVSYYPNLIRELLKMGYRDEDIQKICSGNLLRVWSAVERTAKLLQNR